jgi:4-oxalocrotonate tautomerase family enzyme
LPVVIVETWEGKTQDQKDKLIKGIVKAFEDIGANIEQLQVVIHEVPKSNWGYGTKKQ